MKLNDKLWLHFLGGDPWDLYWDISWCAVWKPRGWTDELQKDLPNLEKNENPHKVHDKDRFGKEFEIMRL